MFADDATVFLADDGVPVSWTPSVGGPAVTGLMLFDRPDQEQGDVVSRGSEVTFVASAWPGLVRGETLVIAGTSFRLRIDPQIGDDAVFATARLTRL